MPIMPVDFGLEMQPPAGYSIFKHNLESLDSLQILQHHLDLRPLPVRWGHALVRGMDFAIVSCGKIS